MVRQREDDDVASDSAGGGEVAADARGTVTGQRGRRRRRRRRRRANNGAAATPDSLAPDVGAVPDKGPPCVIDWSPRLEREAADLRRALIVTVFGDHPVVTPDEVKTLFAARSGVTEESLVVKKAGVEVFLVFVEDEATAARLAEAGPVLGTGLPHLHCRRWTRHAFATGAPLPSLVNASSLEHLSFHDNGLNGALDGSCIINLRHLVTLDLGWNNFTGRIRDSIGHLKRLVELHLDHNMMFGELPSALSNCTNLTTINLKRNNFSGELTKVNFSTLTNQKALDLLYNNFSGTIPESIYSCSNLAALHLSSNNLHGQLSPRIRNLKSLIFLSISSNNFTNITNTLQILKDSSNLTTLLIENNFLGEVMPQDETIDGFHSLQVLCMSGCSLSGRIPRWLSKLQKLQMLSLHANQLSGQIPPWIKRLKSLFNLDISNNNLTGEIPAALMEMPMLRNAAHLEPMVFELPIYRSPALQFRIPIAFPKTLNLAYNNFTGVIPQEVGQLKSVNKLNFSFNMLSGEIPRQLCNLTNLQVLDLSSNHLTGAIPAELNDLHFLSSLNISNNDLEGPIPNGGQLTTFSNSSFGGNPKLCGVMVNRSCGSAEAPPASTLSTEQIDRRVAFAIAFGAFFGVGVLYDQIVLSRYFG
ncbi:hypothetical protein ACP4OV_009519 [Aristida adscensionis]